CPGCLIKGFWTNGSRNQRTSLRYEINQLKITIKIETDTPAGKTADGTRNCQINVADIVQYTVGGDGHGRIHRHNCVEQTLSQTTWRTKWRWSFADSVSEQGCPRMAAAVVRRA